MTPKQHTAHIIEHLVILLLFMSWTSLEELCSLPQVCSVMLKEHVQSEI